MLNLTNEIGLRSFDFFVNVSHLLVYLIELLFDLGHFLSHLFFLSVQLELKSRPKQLEVLCKLIDEFAFHLIDVLSQISNLISAVLNGLALFIHFLANLVKVLLLYHVSQVFQSVVVLVSTSFTPKSKLLVFLASRTPSLKLK